MNKITSYNAIFKNVLIGCCQYYITLLDLIKVKTYWVYFIQCHILECIDYVLPILNC